MQRFSFTQQVLVKILENYWSISKKAYNKFEKSNLLDKMEPYYETNWVNAEVAVLDNTSYDLQIDIYIATLYKSSWISMWGRSVQVYKWVVYYNCTIILMPVYLVVPLWEFIVIHIKAVVCVSWAKINSIHVYFQPSPPIKLPS